jgi:hypothetical protein
VNDPRRGWDWASGAAGALEATGTSPGYVSPLGRLPAPAVGWAKCHGSTAAPMLRHIGEGGDETWLNVIKKR